MLNSQGSNPTLTNVIFQGNTGSSGAAMNNRSSTPTLYNVVFTGNEANKYGAGILNNNSSPSLVNVTFAGNAASSGGGISNDSDSDPSLTNFILWGNSADENGDQIHSFDVNSTPVISYSLVQSSTIGGIWDTSLGVDGGNNIDDDPLFVRNPDPGPDGNWDGVNDDYGDLHLTSGSPAIDAGTNTGCHPSDLDGNPRPCGTYCAMGAYEYWFKVFLPLILR